MRERTNNDLNTPLVVLERVRKVGPIILDPCSNPWSITNALIVRDGYEKGCGLEADWLALSNGGLVFVNPPYGHGQMKQWAEKIAHEAKRGCEIIAIVKGDFSTQWWGIVREDATAICYWSKRIKFGGGAHSAGTFASAVFYYGDRPLVFETAFSDVGDVRLIEIP